MKTLVLTAYAFALIACDPNVEAVNDTAGEALSDPGCLPSTNVWVLPGWTASELSCAAKKDAMAAACREYCANPPNGKAQVCSSALGTPNMLSDRTLRAGEPCVGTRDACTESYTGPWEVCRAICDCKAALAYASPSPTPKPSSTPAPSPSPAIGIASVPNAD